MILATILMIDRWIDNACDWLVDGLLKLERKLGL